MAALLMGGVDRDRANHDERHLRAIRLRQGYRPALQRSDQRPVSVQRGDGQVGQPGHPIPDPIRRATMAIRSEGGIQQRLNRHGRLTIQGNNLRHVLPIRHQWRMDRAGSGGL